MGSYSTYIFKEGGCISGPSLLMFSHMRLAGRQPTNYIVFDDTNAFTILHSTLFISLYNIKIFHRFYLYSKIEYLLWIMNTISNIWFNYGYQFLSKNKYLKFICVHSFKSGKNYMYIVYMTDICHELQIDFFLFIH